jgi:CheY-like chemotaxis protein/HPt (histidine-containing phosphotransfer) domain-containing protein
MTTKETNKQTQKGNQILIVDDCQVNRALVQQFLERAGFTVEIALNGHQALEVLKGKQFDLILMDLVMPGMDGFEASRRIRKAEFGMAGPDHECACNARKGQAQKQSCSEDDCKCRRADSDQNVNSAFHIPHSELQPVPIIGISGHDPQSVMEECCRAGMNDCIGKPLQRESLVSVVRKWTNGDLYIPPNEPAKDQLSHPQPNTIENQPPIDIEKTIAEFMGKTDLLREVLNTFKTRVSAQIMNIKQHLSVNNFNPILSEAHAIKGGAGNLGALNLSQAAGELEEAAAEESSAKANVAMDDLEKEFQRLYQYIEQSELGKAISK